MLDYTFTPTYPSRGILRYRTEIAAEIDYRDPQSLIFRDNGGMNIETYLKR